MAAILSSIIIWGLVVFMLADDYCRKNERNALNFLIILGAVLTIIGIYDFEFRKIFMVSLHDWVVLGLLPIVLINLKLRMVLSKIQSEAMGRKCSFVELDPSEINDKRLVSIFKKSNIVMWVYVAGIIAMNILAKVNAPS